MPVDHDAAAAIARMPLRGEVLIPCPEVLGIRRACGRPFAPNGRVSRAQRAVGHDTDCLPQAFGTDVAFSDIGQVLVRDAGLATRHALKTGVCSKAMQTEKKARLYFRAIERFERRRTFQDIGKTQPQIGFLHHVEQTCHRPGRTEFSLECAQVRRLRLGIKSCQRNPATRFVAEPHERVFRHAPVERM